MIEIFLKFIFEHFLEFLMVGVFLFLLMYVAIGKASGLFLEFVLEGILTILIWLFLVFIFVYLFISF